MNQRSGHKAVGHPPLFADPEEARFVAELVTEIAASCPKRQAGSADERRAHDRIALELDRLGVGWEFEEFEFTSNLYATMALHFGVGVLGTLVSARHPLRGALLHGLAGVSWGLDSSRRAHVLRRLQKRVRSRNLVGRIGPPDAPRRIVLLAHVDAAFTGLVFHPEVVRRANGGRTGETQPYSAHAMELATDAELLLAVIGLVRWWIGAERKGWWSAAEWALTVPAIVVAGMNLDVVLRNTIVPGAADNLTGVASLLVLAERFLARPIPDTEIVLVFTGAEEAGTGGAQRLMERHRRDWDPRRTTVIAVDTMCNGDLRWFREGEVSREVVAPHLEARLYEEAERDPAYREVRPMQVPVGASDAMPFTVAGYPAVGIGCFDAEYGAPRHYHTLNDTPEHIEPDRVVWATTFVERVVRSVAKVG